MTVEDGKGTRVKVGRMPPQAPPHPERQDMWQHWQSGPLLFCPGLSGVTAVPLEVHRMLACPGSEVRVAA